MLNKNKKGSVLFHKFKFQNLVKPTRPLEITACFLWRSKEQCAVEIKQAVGFY